jgi:ABC-2 type transport system permease protein
MQGKPASLASNLGEFEMISDIWTIAKKEMKELITQRGRFRGGGLGMLFFLAVFGIFMPLQAGKAWVDSPIVLVYWAWVPFLLVTSVIADAFAGERERHTLETLLASRLSDRAILLGKITTGVLYGWGLTLICMLLSLVTVNLIYGRNGLLLFPAGIAAGAVGLSFLLSLFAAALGALISLRANSVRQAQQTMSVAVYVVLIPLLLLPVLPQSMRAALEGMAQGADSAAVLLSLIGLLALTDLVLLGLSMARFKRARLILD